jgi:hypothetical protein
VTTEIAESVQDETSRRKVSATQMKRIGIVSALMVIPCFWHEFLVCVDLGSHTYSSWMANLIAAGKAPALYVATQKTNVLFDWILGATCSYFGYNFGEKMAAAIAVLILFWGSFAFLTSLAGRIRWDIAFPLAMFSYGWTFQTGLFNYYLSIGLALAALAALWTREMRGIATSVVLLPLIMLAHPLGLIVFIGFGVFDFVSRKFATQGIITATVISTVATIAVRKYMTAHYLVAFSNKPFWITSGADQFVLYGPIYFAIALVVLLIFLTLGLEAIDRRYPLPDTLRAKLIFVGALYFLVKLVIWLLPDEVTWSSTTAMASLLVNRATLLAGILLIAVMALLPVNQWRTRAWAVLAICFFAALYFSTDRLNRLQKSAFETVRALPAGTRFAAYGNWQPLLAVNNPHLAERACVQHCFVISNYEIASNQFRVRARYPNPFVITSLAEIDRMQAGQYLVRAEDLPLYSLHPCPTGAQVCVGRLFAGDRNGHPSLELGTAVTPAHP